MKHTLLLRHLLRSVLMVAALALLTLQLPASLVARAAGLTVGLQSTTGRVWLDVDGDKAFTSADHGLSGVRLLVYSDNGDQKFQPNTNSLLTASFALPTSDNYVKSVTSGADGNFSISLVSGVRYWITVDKASLPSGVSRTNLPTSLFSATDKLDLRLDSTDHTPPTAQPTLLPLGGSAWLDTDDNNVQTAADQAIAGVTVRIFADDGDRIYRPNASTIDHPEAALSTGDNFVTSLTTDANGAFLVTLPANQLYWVDVDPDTLIPAAKAARSLLPILTGVPGRVDIRFGNTLPPVTPQATEPVVPTAPLIGHVWVDVNNDNQHTSADAPGSGATFWAFQEDGDGIFQPGLSLNAQGQVVGDPFLETIVADASGNFNAALPTGATVLLVLDTTSLAGALDPNYQAQPLMVSVPSEVDLRFPGTTNPDGSPITPAPGSTAEATATAPAPEATAAATAEATVSAAATTEATEVVVPILPTAEVTVEPTAEAPSSSSGIDLRGNVFNDANADRSESTEEPGLDGISVKAYVDDGDGEFDADKDTLVGTVTTDGNGDYLFENLQPGQYWIEVDTATLPDKFVDVFAIGDHGVQNPKLVTVDAAEAAPMTLSALSVEPEATEAPAESTAESTETAAIPEATENAPEPETEVVTGPSFAFAKDTDGDKTPDDVEGTGDSDNDGIPNYLDPFDPSGVMYVDQTGNVLKGIHVQLFADTNGNQTYDVVGDDPADVIEGYDQTTGADGGYKFTINVTDPSGDGIPNDGTVRRFFLIIDQSNLAAMHLTYPSPDVHNYGTFDGSPTKGSGQITPYSTAPNPPIVDSPAPPAKGVTHGYYTQFDLRVTNNVVDDDVVNNHIAFAIDDATLNSYFELTPNNVGHAAPNQTVVYEHRLTNDTGATDTYNIYKPGIESGHIGWGQTLRVYSSSDDITPIETIDSSYPTAFYPTGPIAAGDYLTLRLSVTPPVSATDPGSDTTTITATRSTDASITRTVSDLTNVGQTCLSGTVFNDVNRDGSLNGSDDGLFSHIIVYSVNNFTGGTTGTVFDGVTDTDGTFDVPDLPIGTYRVTVDEVIINGDDINMSDFNQGSKDVTTTINALGCNNVDVPVNFGNPKIDMTVDDDSVDPGQEITYTITVKNTTSAVITNAIVRDQLPDDLIHETSELDQGTDINFDDNANEVEFDLGDLDPGDTREMTIKVQVDDSTTLSTIRNRARLSYDEGPDITDSVTIDLTANSNATVVAATLTAIPATATIPTSLPIGYPSNLPTTGLQAADLLATPSLLAGLAVAVVALIIGLILIVVALRTRGRQHGNHVSAGIVGVVALLFIAVGVLSAGSVFVAASQQPAASSGLAVPTQVAAAPTIGPTETQPPVTVASSVIESNDGSLKKNLVLTTSRRSTASTAQSGSSQLPPGLTLAEWMAGFKPPGKPATRIVIPALNVDQNLVEAPVTGNTWDVTQFTHEIAHLQGTAYPGTVGNAVIAGHVTYVGGAGPFRHLDQLNPGDIILAKGDGVVYRYVVQSVETVGVSDVGVTAPTAGANLTLITCTDWDANTRTYTQRLVVHAVLRPGGARS